MFLLSIYHQNISEVQKFQVGDSLYHKSQAILTLSNVMFSKKKKKKKKKKNKVIFLKL